GDGRPEPGARPRAGRARPRRGRGTLARGGPAGDPHGHPQRGHPDRARAPGRARVVDGDLSARAGGDGRAPGMTRRPWLLRVLVLALPAAFGLRFVLAAVLAFAGARRWARAEGASRGAAEVAAVAFALSGVYVSTWRFFNSALALALAPWVMAAAARLAGACV